MAAGGFALCVCACGAEGARPCLFIAGLNCLQGRFSTNDLPRGSVESAVRVVW